MPTGDEQDSNPTPTVRPFDEVMERYPSLAAPHPRTWAKVAGRATIYEGDVTSSVGKIAELATEPGAMVIVDGDLTLTADAVTSGASARGQVLLVTGDLRAKKHLGFIDSGAAIIEGDLQAETLMGALGDNGGTLRVAGNTTVELLIAASYFHFFFEGDVQAERVVGDRAEQWFPDALSLADIDAFVEELGWDGEVNEIDMFWRLVKGEPVFAD